MSKAILHSMVDLLDDSDTEVIYKVLLKFLSEDEPLPDEIEAYNRAKVEIAEGNVERLEDIDWD